MIDQTNVLNYEQEINQLRIAVRELSVLNDIATTVTSTQSVENVVEQVVQKCVRHFGVEQCAIQLLDEANEKSPFQTMVRKQDSRYNNLPFRLDTQLTGYMLRAKTPLLINDFQADQRIRIHSEDGFPVHTLLSVPMMLKGRMIGLITLFNKQNTDGFTENDQRLLSIISAQSAHVIEHARLYEQEKQLLRFQEDMRMANQIQQRLLPVNDPQVPGYQVTGKSLPAIEVGGDYYDFMENSDTHLGFCLGDISGKGMPASLLMANLQATLRGQSVIYPECHQCIAITNTLMFHSTDDNKFATLFYGILDYEKHELTYCNAGHNQPVLLRSNGTVERLNTGGLVVGFVPSIQYEEEKIKIQVGDLLVIFSDGITEAVNEKREDYDDDRLIELISQHQDKNAGELINLIYQSVRDFTKTDVQADDMTLVIIKRMA